MTAPPTGDSDRECLIDVLHATMQGRARNTIYGEMAAAVLAAGFRRPATGDTLTDTEAEIARLQGELVDMTDERNVLSARLGQWEAAITTHTQHDNCVASDACYEWGFGAGWRAAMTAYQCWCGSPTGPRVPGDRGGVGCLADITHDWLADRCTGEADLRARIASADAAWNEAVGRLSAAWQVYERMTFGPEATHFDKAVWMQHLADLRAALATQEES